MRNSANPRAVAKTAIFVDVALEDGTQLSGNMFVPAQQRLSDMLNDERKFVPLQMSDGITLAIAKTSIKYVTLPVAEAQVYRGSDPYKVLGVEQGVTLEELKRAYHKQLMANHPDRIKGFGLSNEYQELGTKNTLRINEAYMQLLKTVGASAA
jgi:DnaJ-domain-containing protein 1